MSEPTDISEPQSSAAIVAGPGKGYRIKFGIFAMLMIGFGAWFGYDGFVGWPANNEKLRTLKSERDEAVRRGETKRSDDLLVQMKAVNGGEERTGSEIRLQKILCFSLPPVGILLFLRAMKNSRGTYRLENQVLTVPGHPPIPLENITEIDRRLWDRKGIAYISYDLGPSQQGTLRLDDYFHDRPPTDEIFKRVEAFVSGEPSSSPPTEPEESK